MEKENNTQLHVVSYNIQSVGKERNNFENLQSFKKYLGTIVNKPNIICLQETFLPPLYPDKLVSIDGYKLIRCDDNPKRAGVMTYVRNNIPIVETHTNSHLQLVIVRVQINDQIVDISNCYRRQGTKYITPPEVLPLTAAEYIRKYTDEHMKYTYENQRLMVGDFNIETRLNKMPNFIKDMCEKLKVLPTVNMPTTRVSERCIDNQFYSPKLMKLIQSNVNLILWDNPSSPHGLILNTYSGPSTDDFYSSSFTSPIRSQSISESSYEKESSTSPPTNNARTSNDYKYLHNSLSASVDLPSGSVMMTAAKPISMTFKESLIVQRRIQLDPRIFAPSAKPNIHHNNLKIKEAISTAPKFSEPNLLPTIEQSSEFIKPLPTKDVPRLSRENLLAQQSLDMPIQSPTFIKPDLLPPIVIPELPNTKQFLLLAETTPQLLMENLQIETISSQNSPLLAEQSIVPLTQSLLPSNPSDIHIKYHPSIGWDSKFGGLIKNAHVSVIKVTQDSESTVMDGRRVNVHQNPLFTTLELIERREHDHDLSQNYKLIEKKTFVAPPVKAALICAGATVIDRVAYAILATDKGGPTPKQILTEVIMAGTQGAMQTIDPNFKFNGVSTGFIHYTHEHTQANAPLFGSDLRFDNVHRKTIYVTKPFFAGFTSVSAGIAIDKEQIHFSRNNVNSLRDADTYSVRLFSGTVVDISVGFTSGTETSEPFTTEKHGKIQVTQWESQFSGQLCARLRVADRKDAIDIGPAFNSAMRSTIVTTNADKSSISVQHNLPLQHFSQVKDNLIEDQTIIPKSHEFLVDRERQTLPMNNRVEAVFQQITSNEEIKKGFGIWSTVHKTKKFDEYTAKENVHNRDDQQLSNEIKTTLTYKEAILHGRVLRENTETESRLLNLYKEEHVKHDVTSVERDKEVVDEESILKSQISSKIDGKPYETIETERTIGKKNIKSVQKVFHKKIQNMGTNDEISSHIGLEETTATEHELKGTFQPEIINRYEEKCQVFERTKDDIMYVDPNYQREAYIKHKFGLILQTITEYEKISDNGIITEWEHSKSLTLSNAAYNGLSSITEYGLQLIFDPKTRTVRGLLNAGLDVVVEGANGWAHTNIVLNEDSLRSVAIGIIFRIGGSTAKIIASSKTRDDLKLTKLLKDISLATASSVAFIGARVISSIPRPLKTYMGEAVNFTLRTAQILYKYGTNKIDLTSAARSFSGEFVHILTNSGVQRIAIPAFIATLPLSSIGAVSLQAIISTIGQHVYLDVVSNSKKISEGTLITQHGVKEITVVVTEFADKLAVSFSIGENWKGSQPVMPAFTHRTTTTTMKSNDDKTPFAVRSNLPLIHLTQANDNLLKNQKMIIPKSHEFYVEREAKDLPKNGRVERVFFKITEDTHTKRVFGFMPTGQTIDTFDRYTAKEDVTSRVHRELADEIETVITHQEAISFGQDLRETREIPRGIFTLIHNEKITNYEAGIKRGEEILHKESTDKTQITSKKDGSPYHIQQDTAIFDKTTVTTIASDLYRTKRHYQTTNELSSTTGIQQTMAMKTEMTGTLKPKVETINNKMEQIYERTDKETIYQSPHLDVRRKITQNFGFVTNQIQNYEIIYENGKIKNEIREAYRILSDSGYNGLSALTTNALYLYFNPEVRTPRNYLNAGVDIVAESANGWTHTHIVLNDNSLTSVLTAIGMRIVTSSAKTIASAKNRNDLQLAKLSKKAALISAPSIASIVARTTSKTPVAFKNHASIITGLTIRVWQLIQDYREHRINCSDLFYAISQEVITVAMIYGIQVLVPEIINSLQLSPLLTSVATCVTVATGIFSVPRFLSFVKNKWSEWRMEKEFQELCKRFELSRTSTEDQIASQYRRHALIVHPDKSHDDGSKFKKLTEDFQQFHEFRQRYNLSKNKTEAQKFIEMLKEFLRDHHSFWRYFTQKKTMSTDMPKLMSSLS